MSKLTLQTAALALLVVLTACTADNPTETTDLGAVDGSSDAATDVAFDRSDATDLEPGDVEPDIGPVCPPPPGQFGAACESDGDCDSGYCVDLGDSGICTDLCLRDCQPLCDGQITVCRSALVASGDVAFVCQPIQSSLCRTCTHSGQCENGECLTFDDDTQGCGQDCSGPDECPAGYTCGSESPQHDGQCVPISATCSCTEINNGEIRPCTSANDHGVCKGQQLCDAATGWSTCDAETPGPEVCNGLDDECDGVVDNGVEVGGTCPISGLGGTAQCDGLEICVGFDGMQCVGNPPEEDICDGFDNDCDGVVDQDFVDGDGEYTFEAHCGACNNSCVDRFAFAETIICDASGETPTCVIESCEEGYQQLNDTTCAPYQTNLCQGCLVDDDCGLTSPGAACVGIVDVGDPDSSSLVCGRDCSETSVFGEDCPAGFACVSVDRGDDGVIEQCLPLGGTCACVDSSGEFSVPCTVSTTGEVDLDGTIGTVVCEGERTCDEYELGACAVDPIDECNGFDDNCDGTIDEDYRNDISGIYDLPTACGSCTNDCTTRFTEAEHNADGLCVLDDDDVPQCVMDCIDDERGHWEDLFNGTDDGCECEVLSADDTPDRDPAECAALRCDDNCDRVDGDVSRALFVSKVGTDEAESGDRTEPLATLAEALSRAQACNAGTAEPEDYCPENDVRDIYVAVGVYSENLELVEGISIYGGYSLDFINRDLVDNPTTLFGVEPTGGQRGTVTAMDIDAPTTLSGFSIYGFDAGVPDSGTFTPGYSTYAVYLQDSTSALVLADNTIYGARGGPGSAGGPGGSGDSGEPAVAGVDARDLAEGDSCIDAAIVGGAGGPSTCDSAGGQGGDSLCPTTVHKDNPTGLGEPYCEHGAATKRDCLNFCEDFAESQCAFTNRSQFALMYESNELGGDGGSNPAGCVTDCRACLSGCTGDCGNDTVDNCIASWCDADDLDCMTRCGATPACLSACGAGCAGQCDCGRGGGPTYDHWTDTGSCSACGNQVGLPHNGRNGEDGSRGQNGSGGLGCSDTGGSITSSGDWIGAIGPSGAADAEAGGGGGGGSAGAGFAITEGVSGCFHNLGATGGGGGSGGCAGGPGGGGASGGASIGVFIFYTGSGFDTPPTLTDNRIVRGSGGRGGAGGSGGAGGLGGAGTSGGNSQPDDAFCTSPGGSGGDGGVGGAGSGGGGGCGGNAYGIFLFDDANTFEAVDINALRDGNEFELGQGGPGGPGGLSPSAASEGDFGIPGAVVGFEVR